MRLYLSSQRLGTAPQELVALMRGRTRIGVVANAADGLEPGKREARVAREHADLAALGLEPTEVDLRGYFDEPTGLTSALEGLDALWVLGGDVIALRTAFRASGADVEVTRRLEDDSLVYAGYSAGACILGPREALAVADADSTGLGLLPFAIVPHHEQPPESSGTTGVMDHYVDNHIPFIALRDGQAIVVDGDDTRVVE